MPTDAKCGLLVGLGVVVAVAVLYFRTDPPAQAPPTPSAQVTTKSRAPAAAVQAPQPPASAPHTTNGEP
ncbi:MAG TPA: hypothetical protein VKD90_14265 [Gemmataceae bacterium]|nr:hypothetical protein [Gemmataceae bacterium]